MVLTLPRSVCVTMSAAEFAEKMRSTSVQCGTGWLAVATGNPTWS